MSVFCTHLFPNTEANYFAPSKYYISGIVCKVIGWWEHLKRTKARFCLNFHQSLTPGEVEVIPCVTGPKYKRRKMDHFLVRATL